MKFYLLMKVFISVMLLSAVASLAVSNRRLYRALIYVSGGAYGCLILAALRQM